MIGRLLVGLDGSPLAELVLPYVEAFARATEAPVTLVRCIHPENVSEPLPDENPHLLSFMVVMPTEPPGAENESDRNAYYDALNYLDGIAGRLGERGIVAEARVIRGEPVQALVEEAAVRGASLILLCTHGRSGLGKLTFGSVADAVIAQSPIPVLLVRAAAAARSDAISFGRAPILVPLDGTPAAERALTVATELAQLFATKLKLVEVIPSAGSYAMIEGSWLVAEPMELQAEDRHNADVYLGSVVARLTRGGIATSGAVREASISAGIADEAAEIHAGLIVMATHAASTIAQTLLRSVASEVVHQVSPPVLLIGPQVLADPHPN